MQCVSGSACGWGWAAAAPAAASSLQVPLTLKKTTVFNKSSSAMPQSTNKKLGGAACRASREQDLRRY